MTAPNMAAITASLERSFQNCSLNDHHLSASDRSSSSEFPDQTHNNHHLIHSSSSSSYHSSSSNSDSTVELNSHVSLPYQWEQCLDLKTGEIYYQNWRNGMRANQDPRLAVQDYLMDRNDYYYNYYSDDDSSSYDSEGSSSESSPCSSRDHYNNNNNSNSSISSMIKIGGDGEGVNNEDVLVVAGCKRCLMYLMLPKKVENCPQCRSSHLIHFDRSDNNSNHNNA
ncbi:Protein CURLY FLAG LEAF 1 [Linum grandiflorum]